MPAKAALLVEDEADIRDIVAQALRRVGYAVTVVDAAATGAACLERHRFDLLITDLRTPGGMTGCELARLAAARLAPTSIVCMSGFQEQASLCERKSCGSFLRKPFRLTELMKLIPIGAED